MTTGQLIQQARKSAGLSQKQLGEKLGLSASMIGQWENDLRNPKLETIQRIAAALGCDPYSLYSWDQATAALEEHINAQPPQQRISAALGKLNDDGMEKAADAVEVIAEVPRYQAQLAPTAPAEPEEGTDTTPAPEGEEGLYNQAEPIGQREGGEEG